MARTLVASVLLLSSVAFAQEASASSAVPATYFGALSFDRPLPARVSGGGDPLNLRVDFNTVFEQIDRVCFTFEFDDSDLFEPGDALRIAQFGGFGLPGVGGFTSLSSRMLCSEDANFVLSRFLDGLFETSITMESGSVQVTGLHVSLTGLDAKHQGSPAGKGCGSENFFHQRTDECKTRIRFIDPSPSDGTFATSPFTLNVAVKSSVPIIVVRYFFMTPSGSIFAAANREIDYRLTVNGLLADALLLYDKVLVRACAYSFDAAESPLSCTEIALLTQPT